MPNFRAKNLRLSILFSFFVCSLLSSQRIQKCNKNRKCQLSFSGLLSGTPYLRGISEKWHHNKLQCCENFTTFWSVVEMLLTCLQHFQLRCVVCGFETSIREGFKLTVERCTGFRCKKYFVCWSNPGCKIIALSHSS